MNSNMKYACSRILFLMFLVFCGCDYSKAKKASILRASKSNTSGGASGGSSIASCPVALSGDLLDNGDKPKDPPETVKAADLVKLEALKEAVENLDLVSMENLVSAHSGDTPIEPGFLDKIQNSQYAEVFSIGKLVVLTTFVVLAGLLAC